MKNALLILILTFYFFDSENYLYAQRVDGTELTLKKTFAGESMKSNKSFSVDRKLSSLIIDITGTVNSGKIIITLWPPNGDKPKIFEIDVTTTMEFHQTVILKKMPEYIGEWSINIVAENANGSYFFSMRTSSI